MRKSGKIIAALSGILAGAGLGLAYRNKLKKDKAEKNFPPLGHYLSVQGCDLHYLTEGKGRDIIFLHREEGDLYDFYLSPLWNGLKNNFRLTAFDRPGYGYSKKNSSKSYGFRNQGELLNKAVTEIGLEKPLIVAWGESSGVALAMLLEHQENFRGAVLIDDKVPEPEFLSDKLIYLPLIGKVSLWTLLPVIAENRKKNKIKNLMLQGELAEKEVTFAGAPSKILNYAENKRFMDIQELEKLKAYHSENNMPVTVIHGKYDYSRGDDRELFERISLDDIFTEMKIINLPVASEFHDLINSGELLQAIKEMA